MGNPARGGGGSERKLHVAVLMGGWSAEREVSLITGDGVADALESRGHRVTRIDMDRDVAARLAEAQPDVVFNALHGTPGEDGTVQGLMDLMGLKYTHSGPRHLGDRDRQGADQDGARAARHPHAGGADRREREPLRGRSAAAALCAEAGQRGLVGRRRDRHATSGNYGDPIGRDVEGPWQHFDRLLAEPFIRGRELTVAVLGDEALAVTELQPKSGFYDYDAKYTDGHDRACLPGRHPRRRSRRGAGDGAARRTACSAAGAPRAPISAGTTSRASTGLYLLEVNTQPGMTPLSLVPEQARHRGIDYADLVERIVEAAL